MVGAGTYCGKGGVGGVGGLRGAERDGREGREGREGRVGGERAGEGQESKEKIGRLTFSLGAAPQGGSADIESMLFWPCKSLPDHVKSQRTEKEPQTPLQET